jgi:hypothetical protein
MKQKLLLLSISFIVGIGAVSAQVGKGQFYVGGGLSYNYNSFGSESTISYSTGYVNYFTTKVADFSISPEFGFFIGSKWSIGIQPTYERSSGTELSYFYSYNNSADNYIKTDTYHSTVFGFAVDLRYYCMINDKFGFYPQVGVGTQNNTGDLNSGTLNIAATPNFVFFPTPKLGVTLGFGVIGYSLDYKTKDNTFNIGLNNNIYFGLNYYWGKK